MYQKESSTAKIPGVTWGCLYRIESHKREGGFLFLATVETAAGVTLEVWLDIADLQNYRRVQRRLATVHGVMVRFACEREKSARDRADAFADEVERALLRGAGE